MKVRTRINKILTKTSSLKKTFVLITLGLAFASKPSFGAMGWFYYQKGMVKTKVDGSEEYRAPYYPVGYDLVEVNDEFYLQIGIDLGGRFIYDLSTIVFKGLEIEKDKYGLDESFCNLKAGQMSGNGRVSMAYGLDLDWRVNKYREIAGSSASEEKIRVGLGPNFGLRIIPHQAITVFPNISGYFYPWPNKDFAFIPKSFDSYGYRLEVPVIMDLVRLFSKNSRKFFVVSAMPFLGSKSGFYKLNDQTQVSKNSSASVYGIKFGAYWHIFGTE